MTTTTPPPDGFATWAQYHDSKVGPQMYAEGYATGTTLYDGRDVSLSALTYAHKRYAERATLPDSQYEQGVRDALAEQIAIRKEVQP